MRKSTQLQLKDNVRKICGDWWTNLSIKKIEINEELNKEQTYIKCQINFSRRARGTVDIEGSGRGIVDTFFNVALKQLSKDYFSLSQISFKSFKLQTDKKSATTNSSITAILEITNSRKQELEFEYTSYSITSASIGVVLKAIEFLVNSHIAIIKLHHALKDARKRDRVDLIEDFTLKMAELVKVTCYEKSIKNEK